MYVNIWEHLILLKITNSIWWNSEVTKKRWFKLEALYFPNIVNNFIDFEMPKSNTVSVVTLLLPSDLNDPSWYRSLIRVKYRKYMYLWIYIKKLWSIDELVLTSLVNSFKKSKIISKRQCKRLFLLSIKYWYWDTDMIMKIINKKTVKQKNGNSILWMMYLIDF